MNDVSDAVRAAHDAFERYLDAAGYTWEYEPDLGIMARPDYLVSADGMKVVCELKALCSTDRLPSPLGRSMKVASRPLRNDIREAAQQLKELRGHGWPQVVVLSNPANVLVSTAPLMVMSAMYGDLSASVLLSDEMADAITWCAGRNGKLRNDHPYVSAVAVMRWGASDVVSLDVFETVSVTSPADATPGAAQHVSAGLNPAPNAARHGAWSPSTATAVHAASDAPTPTVTPSAN